MRVPVTRQVRIPDQVKLERYRRTPELGPRILFFSGGSALRALSREIIHYTVNTLHIITPFDSGGSSAVIRKAFAMPAVGDIRNRLMSLADQSVTGNPEIFDLFALRLPKDASQKELLQELTRMAREKHPMLRRIPDPMRKIIRTYFIQFLEFMPKDFDLRGASLGNLVLTAGYLSNRRLMDPVIYLFSKLVQVLGTVRPVVNKNLHLAAQTADGKVIVGQHLMTGKEIGPITSRIERIWLTGSLEDAKPVQVEIRKKIKDLIAGAELICYPMGSFYSSLLANFLPQGVGRAVADNACPKVFVPNTSHDPELYGLSVDAQVDRLIHYLSEGGRRVSAKRLLNFILVDTKNGLYPTGLDLAAVRSRKVGVIDCALVSDQSAPYIDEKLLVPVLLSLT